MALLTFDVTAHLLDVRLAHGKCAIAALPMKLFELRTFGLDPFRGAALHFIDNLGNRMVFGEREEHMNMVCHATYNQRRTIMFAQNTCKVFMSFFANVPVGKKG